jgi:hypothetical protein
LFFQQWLKCLWLWHYWFEWTLWVTFKSEFSTVLIFCHFFEWRNERKSNNIRDVIIIATFCDKIWYDLHELLHTSRLNCGGVFGFLHQNSSISCPDEPEFSFGSLVSCSCCDRSVDWERTNISFPRLIKSSGSEHTSSTHIGYLRRQAYTKFVLSYSSKNSPWTMHCFLSFLSVDGKNCFRSVDEKIDCCSFRNGVNDFIRILFVKRWKAKYDDFWS